MGSYGLMFCVPPSRERSDGGPPGVPRAGWGGAAALPPTLVAKAAPLEEAQEALEARRAREEKEKEEQEDAARARDLQQQQQQLKQAAEEQQRRKHDSYTELLAQLLTCQAAIASAFDAFARGAARIPADHARDKDALTPAELAGVVATTADEVATRLAAHVETLQDLVRAASADGASTFTVFLGADVAGAPQYVATAEQIAADQADPAPDRGVTTAATSAAAQALGLPGKGSALVVARVFAATPRDYAGVVAALRGMPGEEGVAETLALLRSRDVLWNLGPNPRMQWAAFVPAVRDVVGKWFVATFFASRAGLPRDESGADCTRARNRAAWTGVTKALASWGAPAAATAELQQAVTGAMRGVRDATTVDALLKNVGEDTMLRRLVGPLVVMAAAATLPRATVADDTKHPLYGWANGDGRPAAFALVAAAFEDVMPSAVIEELRDDPARWWQRSMLDAARAP